MFLRVFVLLVAVVFSVFFLFGCGGGEEIIPGEEIILEKEEWVDPVDIGEKYSVVENVSPGDVISLSTEDGYIVSVGEKIVDGVLIYFKLDEDPNTPNAFYVTEIPRGVVVPEGPPIVRLHTNRRSTGSELVEKHNNVDRREKVVLLSYNVSIDRVLDYHLLVYVEYQTMERQELGGAVHRGRNLLLIPKGETEVHTLYVPNDNEHREFEKVSIRILPYGDMNDLNLPVQVDNYVDASRNPNSHIGLPLEDITVLEGHEYRPYRIASSSFYMIQATPIERNW